MNSTIMARLTDAYTTPVTTTGKLKYSSLVTTAKEINEVEGYIGDTYIGDLYGLFQYLNIPRGEWLITLKANGYKSPQDFGGGSVTIIHWDSTALDSATTLEAAFK